MKRLFVGALAVCLLAAVAQADYIDLPVKWSQVPWDFYGTDWLSDCTAGQVMADDFECRDMDPIVAVRWWGSYDHENWVREEQQWVSPFDISFHFSFGPHPFSIPGQLIVLYQVEAQQQFVGFDSQGVAVYRYDAYLPEEFDQWLWAHEEAPMMDYNVGELFLDICLPTGELWGWHEVVPPHPILDFAAIGMSHQGPWMSTEETDLAFELMTIPEPATMALLGVGLAAMFLKRKR